MGTHADTKAFAGNVVALPASPSALSWDACMKEHETLWAQYKKVSRLQADISQRIEDSGANESAGNAQACLETLPANTKARMAMRLGLQKMKGAPAPTPLDTLKEELFFLAASQKRRRANIRALEKRLLGDGPSTAQDAQKLLDFLAKLVADGRKVDRCQLADALTKCAQHLPKRAGANVDRPLVRRR